MKCKLMVVLLIVCLLLVGCGPSIQVEPTKDAVTPDEVIPTINEPTKGAVTEKTPTPTIEHIHEFNSEYFFDETTHWLKCECGRNTAKET